MSNASQKILQTKKQKNNKSRNFSKKRQKWYDENCYNLKKNLRSIGHLLSKYPNDIYLSHLLFAKKEYKRTVKKQKRQFHNAILNKIELMSENNPKDFWKLVNSIKERKSCIPCKISPSEWFEYFKNLDKVDSNNETTSSEAQIVKDFNSWVVETNEILDRPAISLEEVCN